MLIDVRTPEEYAEAHHDGAINIPVDQIATCLIEATADTPITVHCKSGARAHMAQKILQDRGFAHVDLLNGTGAY